LPAVVESRIETLEARGDDDNGDAARGRPGAHAEHPYETVETRYEAPIDEHRSHQQQVIERNPVTYRTVLDGGHQMGHPVVMERVEGVIRVHRQEGAFGQLGDDCATPDIVRREVRPIRLAIRCPRDAVSKPY